MFYLLLIYHFITTIIIYIIFYDLMVFIVAIIIQNFLFDKFLTASDEIDEMLNRSFSTTRPYKSPSQSPNQGFIAVSKSNQFSSAENYDEEGLKQAFRMQRMMAFFKKFVVNGTDNLAKSEEDKREAMAAAKFINSLRK